MKRKRSAATISWSLLIVIVILVLSASCQFSTPRATTTETCDTIETHSSESSIAAPTPTSIVEQTSQFDETCQATILITSEPATSTETSSETTSFY